MRLRTCALSCLVAATGLATSARADVAGTLTQLGSQSGWTQSAPAISGSGVVWTNANNYNGASATNDDIMYQDVSSSANPIIPASGTTSGENEFNADIDKGTMVWTHNASGQVASSGGDVVLYDVVSGLRAPVCTSSSALQFADPVISTSANWVVYERIGGQVDIAALQYGIDTTNKQITVSTTRSVTNDAAVQLHPRISGDFVVYESYDNPNDASIPQVYGYHLGTSGPQFLIGAGHASSPDVDGTMVVFVGKDANGSDQIFVYDDSTKKPAVQLTTVASNKMGARISGSRIIWSDDRNTASDPKNGLDLYTYNLSTSTEDRIAGGTYDQWLGNIDGNRVVYTSYDANGNAIVQLFTFATATTPGGTTTPAGCDPATSVTESAPAVATWTGGRMVSTKTQNITPIAGRTYILCVDNSSGAISASATFDGKLSVLSAADFVLDANGNPPLQIAKVIPFPTLNVNHTWVGTVGPPQPGPVTVIFSIHSIPSGTTSSSTK